MSGIFSKSIALANRTVGSRTLRICTILSPRLHIYAAHSRNTVAESLYVNILSATRVSVRDFSVSPPSFKTAIQADKFDDSEYHINKTPLKSSKYKAAIDHEKLVSSLSECLSVEKQVEEMCFQLHVEEEEKVTRLKLAQHLEKLLSLYFPNCRVFLVGSSISGFGIKGCDIDLAFETDWEPSMRDVNLTGIHLPSLEDVETGKVSISKIKKFSPKQQLRFARRILCKYWEGFNSPMHLVAGRCPILQFPFGPKQVICDLSFGNSLGVSSTKLLLFCGKMDERIIPLFKIINYWAKHTDLIGSPDKFKSYAFALFLIYFLQTRKPSILPPLKQIFNKAEYFQSDALWDYDFSQDLLKFPKSANSQTIEELLKEFFFFYLFFDFSRTICPLDGCSVKKASFSEDTESETQKIDLGSSICIQDPLNDAWNVTTVVAYKYCKYFVKELLAVCKLYQDPAVWNPSSKKWGLAAVIDRVFTRDMISENFIEFPVAKYVVNKSDNEDVNLWLVRTSEAVLKILSYALLFKCHVTKRDHIISQDGSSNLSASADVLNHSARTAQSYNKVARSKRKEEPLLMAQCSTANTWQGRSNWTESHFSSEVTNDPMEFEHAISLKLIENISDQEKQNFDFILKCVKSEVNGELYLNVIFSSCQKSKFPTKGMIFLKDYVPSLIAEV